MEIILFLAFQRGHTKRSTHRTTIIPSPLYDSIREIIGYPDGIQQFKTSLIMELLYVSKQSGRLFCSVCHNEAYREVLSTQNRFHFNKEFSLESIT
jgi:hypothetical protein